MREQLNNNPVMQIVVIGMLLAVAGFFFLSTSGGGEESEPAGAEATVTIEGGGSGSAEGATPGDAVEGAVDDALSDSAIGEAIEESGGSDSLEGALATLDAAAAAAPPLPPPVVRAWRADRTLVLLFVRDGGIDDRRVRIATQTLSGYPDVSIFVVPAARIYRYAAITRGLGVDRVPALVVVSPKHLPGRVPTASVSYGFQSPESVTQAVVDAGYEGPTRDYHP